MSHAGYRAIYREQNSQPRYHWSLNLEVKTCLVNCNTTGASLSDLKDETSLPHNADESNDILCGISLVVKRDLAMVQSRVRLSYIAPNMVLVAQL